MPSMGMVKPVAAMAVRVMPPSLVPSRNQSPPIGCTIFRSWWSGWGNE
jgi:hypothetical protein